MYWMMIAFYDMKLFSNYFHWSLFYYMMYARKCHEVSKEDEWGRFWFPAFYIDSNIQLHVDKVEFPSEVLFNIY